MITVKRFRSIKDIDPVVWNAINTTNSFFKSYEFLKCIEESGIENSIYWYLLFYSDKEITGATVLSSFEISMDLFLDKAGKKLVHQVRRVFPSFLRVRFLFCGIPISVGKDTILIKNNNCRDEIIDTLVTEMKNIGKELKIPILCIKEFFLDNEYNIDQCRKSGFIRSWSIPYISMDVNWSSFDDYLKGLRHTYRRQIVKSLRKVDFSLLGIDNPALNKDHAVISISPKQAGTATIFYEQYCQVMNNATVILEVLNRQFFENFISSMGEKIDMLTISKDQTVLGSAILVKEEEKLTFLLVGFDYCRRDEYSVYFNLIYGVIAYAIKFGFKKIDLGQTSCYIKQRVGGKGRNMVTYLHSPKIIINLLLRVFNKWISPEVHLKTHHVFKAQRLLCDRHKI